MMSHSKYYTWTDITCSQCEKPIVGFIRWVREKPEHSTRYQRTYTSTDTATVDLTCPGDSEDA